jgi:hypothetical protein
MTSLELERATFRRMFRDKFGSVPLSRPGISREGVGMNCWNSRTVIGQEPENKSTEVTKVGKGKTEESHGNNLFYYRTNRHLDSKQGSHVRMPAREVA